MMLFDLVRARQVGGFDPGYMHAWADDGEYQLRGTLYGFRCLHVPAAAAMHHAKDHGAGRALGQIHNRFRVLLTFYRARTLLVLLPSLLLFELALIAGSLAHGFGGAYFEAVRRTWRERREIGSMRREMQARRQVSDAEILRGGPFEFPGAVKPGHAVRAAIYVMQKLFDANWLVARWVQ
jgi:GT2 family glycosyltransferase